ncbi:hypothetical protein BJX66DRAFT_308651, partial [Aspergillus keveii]
MPTHVFKFWSCDLDNSRFPDSIENCLDLCLCCYCWTCFVGPMHIGHTCRKTARRGIKSTGLLDGKPRTQQEDHQRHHEHHGRLGCQDHYQNGRVIDQQPKTSPAPLRLAKEQDVEVEVEVEFSSNGEGPLKEKEQEDS